MPTNSLPKTTVAAFAFLLAAAASPTFAQHLVDVQVRIVDDQLATGWIESQFDPWAPKRVFDDLLNEYLLSTDPGFDAPSGTFATDPQPLLSLNVYGRLLYWDGAQFNFDGAGFAPTPNGEFLRLQTPSGATVDVTTTSGDDSSEVPGFMPAGIVGRALTSGALHRHGLYELVRPGGGVPAPGLYGLWLELETDQAVVEPSESFIVLFDFLDNTMPLDDVDVGIAAADGLFDLMPPIVGRHLVYGNSVFAGTSLDDAVAVDKRPLLPGDAASLENVSSFDRGINAVAIDLSTLDDPAALTLGSFTLRVGNTSDPATWLTAPTPSLDVVSGGGARSSDRVVLTWDDGQIANQWLEVTMHADSVTGLPADDVFYFGSAIGETGGASQQFLVTAADVIGVRDHPHGSANRAAIDDPFDLNRDRLVNAQDVMIARNAATSPWTALRRLDLTPPSAPATPVPEPTAVTMLLTAGLLAIASFRRRP